MLACTALVGCSNDDEPGVDNGKELKGDAYLTVKLAMSGETASRAFVDNKFEAGVTGEVNVDKAIFYFLDADGQGCADSYPITSGLTWTGTNTTDDYTGDANNQGYDDKISNNIVVIKNPIATPKYLAVLINMDDPFNGEKRPSLEQIKSKVATAGANTSSHHVMTNSVYLDETNVVIGAPIAEENIHESLTDTKDLENPGTAVEDTDNEKPVIVHVERLYAKVRMINPETGQSTDIENNGIKVLDGGAIVYNIPEGNVNSTVENTVDGTNKYQISVRLNTWGLASKAPQANLWKSLSTSYTNAPFVSDNKWWNDATNFRSYWANDCQDTWTPVNEIAKNNDGGYANTVVPTASMYCLENVDNTTKENGVLSAPNATEYVALATLGFWSEGEGETAGTFTPTTFVRWANEIYTEADFFTEVSKALDNYVIKSTTDSETTTYYLNGAPRTAGVTEGIAGVLGWDYNKTVNNKIEGLEDYEGLITVSDPATGYGLYKVSTDKGGKETYTTVTAVDADATDATDTSVQGTIRARIPKVVLWLNGETYYYTKIAHNTNATETAGELTAKSTLYGIVRNHIYTLNITGVNGMGTPAGQLPIDPETLEGDEYTHLTAQVHITSYKVVPTQNVTLGK